MCGITGLYNPHKEVDVRSYYNAHLKIRHRGPDDEGFFSLGGDEDYVFSKGNDTIDEFEAAPHIDKVKRSKLILGHRRLAILDLSYLGHQPAIFENLVLCFNGEIYNYREIREKLRQENYSFNSDSDTEVFLKAYHCWGTDCFNLFNGMWAAAIYNGDSLLLTRDRFGQKPLFYHLRDDDTLIFGSEQKFILGLEKDLEINQAYLNNYIELGVSETDENSIWSSVFQLEPGTYMEYSSRSGINHKKYWDFKPTHNVKADQGALEEFTNLFESAINLRMRSDVEVGSLLSGGLDSNTILGCLSGGDTDLSNFKTFSAVFDEEVFSEKSYIDKGLALYNVKSQYIFPKPEHVKKHLGDLLEQMDGPIRSLSVMSQYLIYKTIKETSTVKVVLNGQGADEAFGGYTSDLFTFLSSSVGSFDLKNSKKAYRSLKHHRGVGDKQIVLSVLKRIKSGVIKAKGFNVKTFEHLTYSALKEYLKYDDRNSMAFGVEARAPFMDYRLMEFAYSLNYKFKFNKSIIREYAKGKVHESIINRKDKMGFISPQEKWQRKELMPLFNEVFENLKNKRTSSVDSDLELKIFDKYKKGQGNWQRVWRTFNYLYWIGTNE